MPVGLALALALGLGLSGCGGASGSVSARVWPPGGSARFSPYVDVTLTPPFDLAGAAGDAGARSLTLAFADAAAPRCAPRWGPSTPIAAPAVAAPAARLRAAGVTLRVSFGGSQGEELARACTNVKELEAAYAYVLARYHAVAADFDLEGPALADRAAMARRARAIALLQARSGGLLSVSLSLPVSRHGLTAGGLAAVHALLAAGVHLSSVNVLAMDYTPAEARGSIAAAGIGAAEAVHRQLSRLGGALSGWGSLGLTAMAGVNDVSGEVLTLQDARTLARFATQRGLRLTSIWSLARDEPCAGSPTAAQATCSGVAEPPYAFSRAFGARPRPGLRPRQAVDRS
jgi:chitinase